MHITIIFEDLTIGARNFPFAYNFKTKKDLQQQNLAKMHEIRRSFEIRWEKMDFLSENSETDANFNPHRNFTQGILK